MWEDHCGRREGEGGGDDTVSFLTPPSPNFILVLSGCEKPK